MKKVLMIAHAFPPFRSVGHSIRVVKFIKYLPALDWLPVVLTIDDKKEYEDCLKQGSEYLLSDISKDVSIYRTSAGEASSEYLEEESKFGERNWLTRVIVKILSLARRIIFYKIFLPDRYVSWVPFAIIKGMQISKSEEIDVIFTTCPPHSATLVGGILKLLTGKPLLLDFRDDWIDTPGYRDKHAIKRWIERRMESWVVKMADKVILVTEWSKNAFVERYPTQPSDKFIFISNGCDLAEYSTVNSIATEPTNHRFVILHAGSLNDNASWTRTPETLFQTVQSILQQQPELVEKLTLAFTGFLPERQKQLAKEMGLSSVVKELGFLQRADLLRLSKSADLLLAINYEGLATLIPGKIYEYWAVGGPPILLLSCFGAASNFVEKHNLGITVEPSNISGIQQAILDVYHQSETDTPMRVNTIGIEAYDRQALSSKLAKVLSLISEQAQQ